MTDVRKTLTDAGYIAIGLGVMGFQQAQVRRRELQGRLESAGGCLTDRARDARGRVEELRRRARPAGRAVEGARSRAASATSPDRGEQGRRARPHPRARADRSAA